MRHQRFAAFLAAALIAVPLALGQAIRPINPDGVDVPAPGPAPKVDMAALAKKGDILFVATVVGVKQVAMTSSMPPTILMDITFKDPQMLRGKAPGNLTFHYNVRGQADPALAAGKKAIVAANIAGNNGAIVAVAEATDENLKALGADAASQPATKPASSPAVEPPAADKEQIEQLMAALKKSPMLFTAKVKSSSCKGIAKSMPPIYMMEVVLEDIKPLRGAAPKQDKFGYSARQLQEPVFPAGSVWLVGAAEVDGTVVIKAMLDATDGNLKNVGDTSATSKPAAAAKVNDAGVFTKFAQAPLVFTARVKEAVSGPTGLSDPPVYSLSLSFDNAKMLRGAMPEKATFNYSIRQQAQPKFQPGQAVVVAAGMIESRGVVTAIVDATDQALADAALAGSLPVGWTVADGKFLSPWSDIAEKAWPKGLATDARIACAKTGRPALAAGAGVTLTVEKIIPADVKKFVNPYGDGEFKITVTNTTANPVEVPALLSDGKDICWANSLVFVEHEGQAHVLPTAVAMKDPKPTRILAGQSVSTTVNTLLLKNILWPNGGSRVYLTFALGDLAAGDFFYYMTNHHEKLRAEAIKKLQP